MSDDDRARWHADEGTKRVSCSADTVGAALGFLVLAGIGAAILGAVSGGSRAASRRHPDGATTIEGIGSVAVPLPKPLPKHFPPGKPLAEPAPTPAPACRSRKWIKPVSIVAAVLASFLLGMFLAAMLLPRSSNATAAALPGNGTQTTMNQEKQHPASAARMPSRR